MQVLMNEINKSMKEIIMTKLYMGGEDLPDDYVDENGAHYDVNENIDPQVPNNTTSEHDRTYENESQRDLSPMVQISVREYDKLKEQGKYITDPTLIGMIDKMEFFLKELRKHIVRKL